MTLRTLVSSLQIALRKTMDDTYIPLSQIAMWCTMYINKFNSAKIPISNNGRYLTIFPEVPVNVETVSTTNLIKNRKYIELPAAILDLKDDGAINYIAYNDFDGICPPSFTNSFTRTTIRKSGSLYYNPYTAPSTSNVYWYAVGNYVYFLGLECININSLEIGLNVAFDPFADCGIDENMSLDEGLVADVYNAVMSLGKSVMLLPESKINDASGTEQTQTTARQIGNIQAPPPQQTQTE